MKRLASLIAFVCLALLFCANGTMAQSKQLKKDSKKEV